MLGSRQPIYAADVRHPDRETSAEVFARRSLILDLLPSSRVRGAVLSRCEVPQFELKLLGTATELDYGGERLTVIKTSDDRFGER
jgi:hypothetical protein